MMIHIEIKGEDPLGNPGWARLGCEDAAAEPDTARVHGLTLPTESRRVFIRHKSPLHGFAAVFLLSEEKAQILMGNRIHGENTSG